MFSFQLKFNSNWNPSNKIMFECKNNDEDSHFCENKSIANLAKLMKFDAKMNDSYFK